MYCSRLKQHENSKDFWTKVCIVTGKDENLTKTHIKYLESRLIQIALSNSQCELMNGTSHLYNKLPESDTADMEYFLEQIQMVLPVLGYGFLKEQKTSENPILPKTNAEFVLNTKDNEVKATAQLINNDFYVLKGSRIRKNLINPNTHSYLKKLRPALLEKGIIDPITYTFSKDYLFNSPSAASAVILGRSSNGRIAWKHITTNQTFAEWEQSMP